MRTGQLLALLGVSLILASASYTLGKFNARDTISRPEVSWALGSSAAIKISDLSISLEHAANAIRERNPEASENELGKAYDYLSELLAASVEMHIAKGDTTAPEFTDWMSGYRKFLGDSPDAIYSTAPVDASLEYEIEIMAGTADYFGLVVYERNPITGWNRVADSISIIPETKHALLRIPVSSKSRSGNDAAPINSTDVRSDISAVDINASTTRLNLASRPNQDLSLTLSDRSHMIMVREYFFDSETRQPSKLAIRPLAINAHRDNTEVDTIPFEARAENAVNFFNETWQGSLALADALKETANSFDRPSTVSPDFVGIFYPTPDNDYHGGAFSLQPGEALIIEGEVPTAAFWSITLQNHWMQSIQNRGKSASLTGNQITNRQGTYRVWISDTAPPAGEDWLDTGGESEGLVAIRYLLADNASAPRAKLHR